ncbi:ABC transporter substrate-binding protein [Paenibacillus pectinilyticus]|uniref:ABC transporter substrate-binding protein n=1 Tax=Paenibacillus pectinilyticus TaxID=512399 RepID=A0A1C0ZT33_9BACL|nr:extracellular solute-binding protein [Paenibacillus pectinilyticus]OCT11242.1 ABC transporter substrate-binding protein [Paenibacillus pectinilyticus]
MNRNKKTIQLSVISVAALSVLLAGCSSDTTKTTPAASGTPAAATATASVPEVKYPTSFTYWVPMNANAGAVMKNYNEMAAYKEIEKKTGTKVDFQHPPTGQEKDQFNIMLASNSLPDVVEYNFASGLEQSASQSPDSLIKGKQILRLNELIEKNAPNLTKVLKDHPDFRKLITTDEGNIYVMPFLLGDEQLSVVNGPVFRQDWLDKLGLKVPTTVPEWETVLTAFRDKDPNGNGKKDEIPFFMNLTGDFDQNNLLVGAWGISTDYYNDKGKVKYGPIQPEYKEFVATLARWYKDGLIDKDYASIKDSKLKDAKITGNQVGAFSGYAGSGLGRYLTLMQPTQPSFSLVGAPYPKLKEGAPASLGQYTMPFTGYGAAVSAKAKNPEEIIKWLDYKYGQEGSMLMNFGIEGTSYKMENGYPKYTDLILNNPDKLPIAQAMAKYFQASWNGPFVQDKRYIEQYYTIPAQRDAQKTWTNADHTKQMPGISLTAEESSKTASIMNDVKTYRDEMFNKFVMGAEPIENFDKYVQTMKSMGVEDAIKVRQAALDRFNSRK